MMIADIKQVLNLLSKKALLQLPQAHGKGWSALTKPEVINRLVQDKSTTLAGILSDLKMPTLTCLCQDLGVKVRGISRRNLIDRALVQVELFEKPVQVTGAIMADNGRERSTGPGSKCCRQLLKDHRCALKENASSSAIAASGMDQ